MTTTVHKQLAAMQDMTQGVGEVLQSRNGKDVTVNKVDLAFPVNTEAELKLVDISVFNRARIVISPDDFIEYRYDASDETGIDSTGPGTWITVVDKSNIFNTTVELKLSNLKAGRLVNTTGYHSVFDGGLGNYLIKTETQANADNELLDNFGNMQIANGNWAILQVLDGEVNAKALGVIGIYQNDRTAIYALEVYIRTYKVNCLFPNGEYDIGEDRFPFKSDQLGLNDPLVDYGGITLRGETRDGVVFSVTTDVGRDVLNMNKVSNITIKNLTLTSYMVGKVVQTEGNSNISNGCSLTGGTQNVHIDVDVKNCLGVPKTVPGIFLDGGKAFTLQPGTAAGFGFANIVMKGKALNCGYGTGMDVTYEQFNVGGQGQPYNGIDVDIIAEDCYRACVFSAAAAVDHLDMEDADWQGRIRVVAINCAQGLITGRWVGGDFDVHIINNKTIGDLYRPLPSDQDVYASNVINTYRSKINVHGRMTECTYIHKVGAGTQGGGVGVNGQCDKVDARLDVDCPSIIGVSGADNGAGGLSFLTDTTQNWEANEFIGQTITNITDGSIAVVTSNTSQTIEGVLFGGTNNDWDPGDSYIVQGDLKVTTAFGNPAVNSIFTLLGITDSSYRGLIESAGIFKPEWMNTINAGGADYTQNSRPQSIIVERQQQDYSTFEVDGVSGLITMLRAGSGSAGAIDGFLIIKDAFSGSTYKLQLYT